MYKTAVYTLVNGVITHQKQQISKKVILLSSTLTLRPRIAMCQSDFRSACMGSSVVMLRNITILIFAVLICNDAVN